MSGRVALFWDIDGTLLTTARAGIASLEDALEQVTGVRTSLAEATTAGLTDYAIAEAALRAAGDAGEEPRVREFLEVHSEQLHAYLGRRRGRVMPNVREILAGLEGRGDVVSMLLTGNTETGAWAKLRHYGLDRYFSGGAFCAGPGERSEIARRVVELAGTVDAAYVVGDTPHDIEAGDAIGARTIAVATGSYTEEELATHEPWTVLAQLPKPAEFCRLIGLPG